MKTLHLQTDADIDRAAEIIQAGGLVAVPTETVYGLAANGLNEQAVARIYEVKGRPEQKALSLMVSGSEAFEKYCCEVSETAYALAKRYWPGPLTIVLKSNGTAPDIVTAGGDTVALRCPKSELTLALLKKSGVPLAAPSANPSGAKSPVTAQEVFSYFDGKIEGVLDGGACSLGLESTILSLVGDEPKILRQGALKLDKSALTIIGITGGTGCGKTTALQELWRRGARIIDCDAVYHELIQSNQNLLNDLQTRFPGSVENGVLQRKKLGELVFSDENALQDLNAITHGYVSREVENRLTDWAMRGGSLAAIDAISLIESDIAADCRYTVGILAPTEDRIRRLMKRDGISREYAQLRISAQKPGEYFRENCDYVLENTEGFEQFELQCKNFFDQLLGR